MEGDGKGARALEAWGAHNFKASEASDRYGLSWLLFKVDGTLFQGWVRVALRGIDIPTESGVFSISLEKFNNNTAEYGTTQVQHGVKSTDLASTIDRLVEGDSKR